MKKFVNAKFYGNTFVLNNFFKNKVVGLNGTPRFNTYAVFDYIQNGLDLIVKSNMVLDNNKVYEFEINFEEQMNAAVDKTGQDIVPIVQPESIEFDEVDGSANRDGGEIKEDSLSWVKGVINKVNVFKNKVEVKKQELKDYQEYIFNNSALDFKDLKDGFVLNIVSSGYTPSVGMLHVIEHLERHYDQPLYKVFNLFVGTGNAAVISCALALGISTDVIMRWFLGDWKNVHETNRSDSLKRRLHNFALDRKDYRYGRKKMVESLKRLFSRGGNGRHLFKMKDIRAECDVVLTILYGDMDTYRYSKASNPERFVADVVLETFSYFDYQNFHQRKGYSENLGEFSQTLLPKILLQTHKNGSKAKFVNVGSKLRVMKKNQSAKYLDKEEELFRSTLQRNFTNAVMAKDAISAFDERVLNLEISIPYKMSNSTRDDAINASINAAQELVERHPSLGGV